MSRVWPSKPETVSKGKSTVTGNWIYIYDYTGVSKYFQKTYSQTCLKWAMSMSHFLGYLKSGLGTIPESQVLVQV